MINIMAVSMHGNLSYKMSPSVDKIVKWIEKNFYLYSISVAKVNASYRARMCFNTADINVVVCVHLLFNPINIQVPYYVKYRSAHL
jgi:hypothetical protein